MHKTYNCTQYSNRPDLNSYIGTHLKIWQATNWAKLEHHVSNSKSAHWTQYQHELQHTYLGPLIIKTKTHEVYPLKNLYWSTLPRTKSFTNWSKTWTKQNLKHWSLRWMEIMKESINQVTRAEDFFCCCSRHAPGWKAARCRAERTSGSTVKNARQIRDEVHPDRQTKHGDAQIEQGSPYTRLCRQTQRLAIGLHSVPFEG